MKRKIVIILGSKSDLKQCAKGLGALATHMNRDEVEVVGVYVKSIHRHTEALLKLLRALSAAGQTDVIIAAAGKAAHLPGCIDAYLRNHLRDTNITVIGVGFEGETEQDNLAAKLSITQVPGTQVIFAGQGSEGFYGACLTACEAQEFPVITLKEIPPDLEMTLDEACQLATAQLAAT